MSEGKTRYRVGIIGTGRIASTIQDEIVESPFSFLLPYSHAGAYQEHPRMEIVAGADSNAERLAAFGERWQVPNLYADYRQMLADGELDIVSVCVPTRAHAEVMQAVAASSVRGVFMEKPICRTLREADEMIAATDAAGIKVVVNHVRSFDPHFRRVRHLIASGAIGQVRSIMAHWHEGMSFGGSHFFDAVRHLLDAEPTWVFGHLDEGDGLFDFGGSGVVGFPNDIEVFVDNRVGHAAPRELDIVGTSGRIRIGDHLPPELYTKDESSPFGELVKRPFPGSVWGKSPMAVAVAELAQAIETGGDAASDLRDGRANLEIAVAFYLSARERRAIDLPLPDEALDLVVDDPWGRS